MKVGPYEIEGSIGSGATGTVFRARDPHGVLVAVKVLNRLSGGAVARFERERRLQDSLTAQDGFVPLLDSGGGAQGPWLAMPFIPGGTLRTRLAQGRASVEEATRIATQLARALGRANALGIVHRDMKPENVLFTAEGEPLIADLGLAKHFEGEAARTASLSQTGELRGTAGYAPIEQMNDAKAAGPPADVFAVGAMLYELVAGAPAFMAPSIVELLAKVEDGDFVPLATARPGTPAWLATVVE
ncbi:MAG: serine/threonine-protein kinase, partial [Planctomycetota bacterium]